MSTPLNPDEHLCIQKDTTSEQILAQQTSIFQVFTFSNATDNAVLIDGVKLQIAGGGAAQ